MDTILDLDTEEPGTYIDKEQQKKQEAKTDYW